MAAYSRMQIVSLRQLIAVSLLLFAGCGDYVPQPDSGPAGGSAPGENAGGQSGSGPAKPASLTEARRGFQTKLLARKFDNEPVAQPPENLFQIVGYDAAPGMLAAYLSVAPGDRQRHPAIVWITGGDCNSVGSVWDLAPRDNDQTASAFREAGIVMMYPTLRGGNGGPGVREGFLGEVDDVLAAAEYLGQQKFVDPQRIYLGGHSTGGTLVLLVAAASDRFRGVFSFGPVAEITDYGPEFIYFDTSNPRELELRNPINWLASIRCPTFVFEGTAPPTSNADSVMKMSRSSQNPLVKFFPVGGVDHFGILFPITRLVAQKILADSGPQPAISFTAEELQAALR